MSTATVSGVVRQLGLAESFAVSPESDAALLTQYARHTDHAAFAELLRRHGPVVFGACRRVLNDIHDAEDAFQATFLVLAMKAYLTNRIFDYCDRSPPDRSATTVIAPCTFRRWKY